LLIYPVLDAAHHAVNFIPGLKWGEYGLRVGIGMFLAGLVSGAGLGWYSGILRERIRQTDPKKNQRESAFYRHLLSKAGLSEDEDKAG
jgi:hypothetical protein